MSFILEALKKSEQQRQEQNASQQQVRKRTLSLQTHRSERRLLPWLLAGLVPLLLFGGWWLYSERASAPGQPPELSLATSAPVVTSPANQAEPAVTPPAQLASTQKLPVAAAEPAPVPSVYAAAAPVKAKAAAVPRNVPAEQPQRFDALPATEVIKADEPVAVVAAEATSAQAIDPLPLEARAGQMPRYSDLSGGLRARMPALAMSMHFYNNDPDRRLVRINDRLLREGDWVGSDLELAEITPVGVILDFQGQVFELSRARQTN